MKKLLVIAALLVAVSVTVSSCVVAPPRYGYAYGSGPGYYHGHHHNYYYRGW